jgi:hypothetical protein
MQTYTQSLSYKKDRALHFTTLPLVLHAHASNCNLFARQAFAGTLTCTQVSFVNRPLCRHELHTLLPSFTKQTFTLGQTLRVVRWIFVLHRVTYTYL